MFAPIVVLLRDRMGKVKFNKLRGEAIKLHSQVISNFCESIGIERNTRQNMIRTARDNGKKLGLLA